MRDDQTNARPKIGISKAILNGHYMLLAFTLAFFLSCVMGFLLLSLCVEMGGPGTGLSDYPGLAVATVLCLLCVWVLFAALVLFQKSTLSRVFADDERATATIIDVWSGGKSWWVIYEYDWRGMHYRKRQALTDGRVARSLVGCESFELVVDATCPTRVFMRRLYVAE